MSGSGKQEPGLSRDASGPVRDMGGSGMKEPLIGRLALCLFGLVLWSSLLWTFSDLALAGYFVVAGSYLAITARTRPVRWIASAATTGAAALFLLLLPEAFPLQARIRGARFEDTPVAEVLCHIARQKTTAPSWRFYAVDEPTSSRRVSVTVREGASLREALDAVAAASGCEYRWNWHKSCGNADRPLCAEFWFRRAGLPTADPCDWVLLIDRHGVFDRRGQCRPGTELGPISDVPRP